MAFHKRIDKIQKHRNANEMEERIFVWRSVVNEQKSRLTTGQIRDNCLSHQASRIEYKKVWLSEWHWLFLSVDWFAADEIYREVSK